MSSAIVPYVHPARHFKFNPKENEMKTAEFKTGLKAYVKTLSCVVALFLLGVIATLFAVNGAPKIDGFSIDLNPMVTQQAEQIAALQQQIEMKQRVVEMIAKERAEMITIAATLRVAYNAELQKGCIAKMVESTKPQQEYVKDVGSKIAVYAERTKEYVSGIFK